MNVYVIYLLLKIHKMSFLDYVKILENYDVFFYFITFVLLLYFIQKLSHFLNTQKFNIYYFFTNVHNFLCTIILFLFSSPKILKLLKYFFFIIIISNTFYYFLCSGVRLSSKYIYYYE